MPAGDLAAVLSGAGVYGAGVNIGLGAERLRLTARTPGAGLLSKGQPSSARMTGGSERAQG